MKKCCRKPYGRICVIIKEEKDKLLIRDTGCWTGWVTRKVFENKWKLYE